jgi:hypothetical protein
MLRSILLVPMMVRVERFRAPYPDGAGSAARACPTWEPTTLYERAARKQCGRRQPEYTHNCPCRALDLMQASLTCPYSLRITTRP